MKNNKIKLLFEKIKKAHDIYVKCSNEKQIAIMGAFEFVFKELEQLGVTRHFSESLLVFGKEFVDSLNTPVVASPYGDLTPPTSPIEPLRPATNEEIEAIFEAKLEPLGDKEQRELELAVKYNVIAWESLPAPDGKVKIKALIKAQQKLPIDKEKE